MKHTGREEKHRIKTYSRECPVREPKFVKNLLLRVAGQRALANVNIYIF